MNNFAPVLKEIGEFGLFQKRMLAILVLPNVFTAIDLIGQVFVGMSYPHHCNTDWIRETGPNLTEEMQKNLTIPVSEDGSFESCRMFSPVDLDLESIEKYGLNATTGCIDGVKFELPEGASTILSEFDLVCDNSYMIKVAQAVSMSGFLVGSLMTGAMADRFGRRFVILICVLLLMVFGVGAGLSPNIHVYMFSKFCSAISVSGLFTNSFVIVGEWTDASRFALSSSICHASYNVGLIILPGVAYLIPNWRVMHFAVFGPLLPILGLLYWYLPESARWLITQGRRDEAVKLIKTAAQVNGRSVSEELLDKFENETPQHTGNMLELLKIPYLRKRVLIMNLTWFSTSLLNVGLSLNVEFFGMNIYLMQLIFGLVEFPSHLGIVPFIQYFGRRICLSMTLLIGGIGCLVILGIPADVPLAVTVIAVLGKFSVSASFTIIYIYTAELYPTIMRQNGIGLNSSFARVAGILSPLVTLLSEFHYSLPMIIYGSFPITAAGLTLLLPETCNVEIADHAEQMGNSGDDLRADPLLPRTNQSQELKIIE